MDAAAGNGACGDSGERAGFGNRVKHYDAAETVKYCFGSFEAAALGGVFGGVLVLTECEEAEHAFVAAESGFELANDGGFTFKLDESVEAGRLLLDGISELAHAPFLGVHDGGTLVGEHLAELFYRFLHLCVRQNGS